MVEDNIFEDMLQSLDNIDKELENITNRVDDFEETLKQMLEDNKCQ